MIKGGDLLLEKLEYINRVQKFLNVLVECAKTEQISQQDFYSLLGYKCRSLEKERINEKRINL